LKSKKKWRRCWGHRWTASDPDGHGHRGRAPARRRADVSAIASPRASARRPQAERNVQRARGGPEPEALHRHPGRQGVRHALAAARLRRVDGRPLAHRHPAGQPRHDLEGEAEPLDLAVDGRLAAGGAELQVLDRLPAVQRHHGRAAFARVEDRYLQLRVPDSGRGAAPHPETASSGRSVTPTSAGPPARRSGRRAGAWPTSAEPSRTRSVRSGARVRARSRRAASSGFSSSPMTASAPRPARAAGAVRLRLNQERPALLPSSGVSGQAAHARQLEPLLDCPELRGEFTHEPWTASDLARVLARLEERGQLRERLPPASLVVGRPHAGR
jgi:hypothetical protein